MRFVVRKLVSRVEEVEVEAENERAVENMIRNASVPFHPEAKREKHITFEIIALGDLPRPVVRQKKR